MPESAILDDHDRLGMQSEEDRTGFIYHVACTDPIKHSEDVAAIVRARPGFVLDAMIEGKMQEVKSLAAMIEGKTQQLKQKRIKSLAAMMEGKKQQLQQKRIKAKPVLSSDVRRPADSMAYTGPVKRMTDLEMKLELRCFIGELHAQMRNRRKRQRRFPTFENEEDFN